MLKACLNGARLPAEHPALPVTPEQLGAAAAEAVTAGADVVHLHPKDASGHDTLDPDVVAAAVLAVRSAVPGLLVGVTTGDWASAGPDARLATVRAWTVLPDFASVNWMEAGSVQLADLLLERGVGVEAGLFEVADVQAWQRWASQDRTLRVLLEVDDLPGIDPVALAVDLCDALARQPAPADVVLHGLGAACWPVLREATRRGLNRRIGLEDTLLLPDGTVAANNAQLVSAALRITTG